MQLTYVKAVHRTLVKLTPKTLDLLSSMLRQNPVFLVNEENVEKVPTGK
jgi:hypothetical protein